KVAHIELAKNASILVVAPASANTIAKFANGIGDNILTDVYLANTAPVLLAPAMNTNMLEHPATKNNLNILFKRGVNFIEPISGNLACGTSGKGKMANPIKIVEKINDLLNIQKDFKYKVLITAGPTIEPIDPVRYISNYSSGKMGYALAKAASARGADVTLVTGPVNIPPPANVEIINIKTTDDLMNIMGNLAPRFDIVIQAAAPSDFKLVKKFNEKIKKNNNNEGLLLELVENVDVAATIGKEKKKNQIFVGFAAETNNVYENSLKKLKSKNLDMIVSNDVTQKGAGFGVDTNIANITTLNGTINLDIMSKIELSNIIIDEIIKLK
ncbi:MAG: bifunctional phosphopantothenoylcysteine decarboxylase/phosphopantothenate--cysteine ligase CoaBC, partial [Christensenellaceae bacterium]|nr:bifunctional phosphopantothenoylcysteine decarboxylase/phosphopantothenate--cysteine ligase CoaBC [Christensenellaceae bacterium]